MNPVHVAQAVIPRQVVLRAHAYPGLVDGGEFSVQHRPVVIDEDIPIVKVVLAAILTEEENPPVTQWGDVHFELIKPAQILHQARSLLHGQGRLLIRVIILDEGRGVVRIASKRIKRHSHND